MGSSVYILSGPIQSGKTSAVYKFLSQQATKAGILCPYLDEKRHIQFLPDPSLENMEVGEEPAPAVAIGKFSFDQTLLERASSHLTNLLQHEAEWYVIDEIGKLEMEDKGYEPGLSHFIRHYLENRPTGKLLLLVRDYLIDDVKEKYGLQDASVISISDLLQDMAEEEEEEGV